MCRFQSAAHAAVLVHHAIVEARGQPIAGARQRPEDAIALRRLQARLEQEERLANAVGGESRRAVAVFVPVPFVDRSAPVR